MMLAASLLAACGSQGAKTASPAAAVSTAQGSSNSSPATSSLPAKADVVNIKNFAFTPSTLTVSPGATVIVHNEDVATHTLTSTSGAFNTGDVSPGTSKTFVAPKTPGTYPYICEIHQFMHGTLIVR